MFAVGIDIAKHTHVAAIFSVSGECIGKPFKFSNTCEGFDCLLEKLHECSTSIDDFEFGMESTGQYWLNLMHCVTLLDNVFILLI